MQTNILKKHKMSNFQPKIASQYLEPTNLYIPIKKALDINYQALFGDVRDTVKAIWETKSQMG